MRAVYDQVDWSATPLGPRDAWPALLRLVVDLCLDSEFPVQISWGPDLLVLYNEAYIPLLGAEKTPMGTRSAGERGGPASLASERGTSTRGHADRPGLPQR